jgi:hypothetical protein
MECRDDGRERVEEVVKRWVRKMKWLPPFLVCCNNSFDLCQTVYYCLRCQKINIVMYSRNTRVLFPVVPCIHITPRNPFPRNKSSIHELQKGTELVSIDVCLNCFPPDPKSPTTCPPFTTLLNLYLYVTSPSNPTGPRA